MDNSGRHLGFQQKKLIGKSYKYPLCPNSIPFQVLLYPQRDWVGNLCVRDFFGCPFPYRPRRQQLVEQSLGSLGAQIEVPRVLVLGFSFSLEARGSSSVLDAKPRLFLCSFKIGSLLN